MSCLFLINLSISVFIYYINPLQRETVAYCSCRGVEVYLGFITVYVFRLCFYTCLSVILFKGGSASVHAGIPSTPLPEKQTQTPQGPGTPTPGTRNPQPRPSNPQTRHHPGSRPPRDQAPPRADTPRDQGPPGSRRLLLRTVRIILECILVPTERRL